MLINKILKTLVIISFLGCTYVSAQDWNWKPFKPAEQPWTILAPGPMKPDAEAEDIDGPKGSYSYNDFNGFFAVIYRDSPRRFLPWKPNYSGYIENVRDDVIEANRGELLKETDFTNHGVKGREAYVKFPTGTTQGAEGQTIIKYRVQRFRMFFIGRRFYVILAVMNENLIDKPEIDRYFESFSYNSPPVAVADAYSTDEDTTLTIPVNKGVLSNDRDAERDPLSVSTAQPLTQPAHGSLTLNADGSLTYIPVANFYGKDSFSYAASDGLIDSAPATVTITVNPVNDPPTIANVPPSATIDELTQFGFTPTANDIDNPVSSLRFSLLRAPAGMTINPQSGTLSWIPSEAQGPGIYGFQVSVSDGAATVSAPVIITVNEVNVAPQISNANVSQTINELDIFSLNIRATDSDIPAQTLTYTLTGAPSGATIDSSTGEITWSPTEAQGDNSTYKFTVRVSDGIVNTDANINLTVREINSTPTLKAITDQTVDELKPLSVTASGSDIDLPANTLTYSLESGAPNGMTINSQTGVISWTPTEAQGTGDYSVTVRLTDNGSPSLSDTKTFKVHVNEVNVAPTLNRIGNKTVDEETSLTFNATATDTDLPANTLTYSLINAPTGAVINPSTGAFSWTPTEAQGAGSYSVTVRVTDNGTPALSAEETITITVNEVNKAPVANDMSVNTDEDNSVSLTLKGSDVDLPANTLRFAVVGNPAHGTISGTAPNLTYIPNPDYNGSDSFTFKINDGALDSNTATVRINVNPVNDAPVANPDSATTDEDAPVNISVLTNDSDVDSDKIVLTSVSNVVNGKAEIVGDAVRFTPNAQFSGAASFDYTISDGKGGTSSGKVNIIIRPKPRQQ